MPHPQERPRLPHIVVARALLVVVLLRRRGFAFMAIALAAGGGVGAGGLRGWSGVGFGVVVVVDLGVVYVVS